MDAIDCIMTRASERSFTGEKVKKDDILKILKAGMAAPSAVNIQPWSFIVVDDEELLTELTNSLPNCRMLKHAGTGIIVCGLPEKDPKIARKHWMHDCSAATENILLAAHALGYGAVWTAVHPDEERIAAVKKILEIPQSVIPFCVIPIGVVSHKTAPKDKFSKEIIHNNGW